MAGFVSDAVNLYGDAYKRMGKAAGGLLSDATNRFGSNAGYIGDYLSEGLLKPRTSSVPPNVLPPNVRFDQNLQSFGDAIRPRLTPQGTNSTADFFSNLLGQDQKEAAILAGTGEAPTTPPPPPPEETPTATSETQPLPFTTAEETKKAQEAAKSLQEVQVTAQRRKMAEQHNVLATRTREQLLSQGADEKQLEGWDKFTDQFDLTTVGLALLANNDGGDVFANLGKALLLGKAQKDQYRTEDLEQSNLDRTFLLDVFNKESQINRRTAQTDQGERQLDISQGNLDVAKEKLPYDKMRAEAAGLSARATMANAFTNRLNLDSGKAPAPSNPTGEAWARQGLSALNVKPEEFEGLKEEEVLSMIGSLINTEMRENPDARTNPTGTAVEAVKWFLTQGAYKNTTRFGQDWEAGARKPGEAIEYP